MVERFEIVGVGIQQFAGVIALIAGRVVALAVP